VARNHCDDTDKTISERTDLTMVWDTIEPVLRPFHPRLAKTQHEHGMSFLQCNRLLLAGMFYIGHQTEVFHWATAATMVSTMVWGESIVRNQRKSIEGEENHDALSA